MGISSSWKNRVEEGVPRGKDEQRSHANEAVATGIGENAGKREAGLPDGEACDDEDDDEDD